MYEFVIYNLKAGACLAVFYLFFKLLLGRETFHRINRVLLLSVVGLSFILPLCIITIYKEIPEWLETLPAIGRVGEIPVVVEPSFPWERILGIIYLAGVAASSIWTLTSLLRVVHIIRSGRQEQLSDGTILVRRQELLTPFSWIKYIVISEIDYAESGAEIITHEQAHIRLRHSYDLLATDLLSSLQWFNPAMWLLRSELRSIHEYEADEAVLNSGIDAKKYQLLLIKKAAGGRWYSIANSFNHSKLKNRITMMLRKKSSKWAGVKVLFVLPLLCVALSAFAETVYVRSEDKGTKKSEKTVAIADKQPVQQPTTDKTKTKVFVASSSQHKQDTLTANVRLDFINMKQKPLILVDGKRVADGNNINPATIESVQVLKGGDLAVYGEEAKNGVVLVTLKSADKPRIKITTEIAENSDLRDTGTQVKLSGTIPAVRDSMNRSLVVVSTQISGKSNRVVVKGQKFNSSDPFLWILDGKEISGKDLAQIDAETITSVVVLEDDRTIEKYGEKAKYGVVEVTTKKK